MKRNWDHTDCAVPLSGDFTAPPKWHNGVKYLPVYLHGAVVGYAPEASHPGHNPAVAKGFYYNWGSDQGMPCQ